MDIIEQRVPVGRRTAYRTRLDILRAAQLKRDIFGQNDQDITSAPGSTVQNLVDDLFPSDHQETDTPHQAAVRLSIHDWISRHSGINSSYEPVSPIELLNSIQRVKNDKSPGSKKQIVATVQGSVLGPLFWNIIVDDLLQRDHGPNVHVQAYADDIVAVVADKSTNGLGESISSLISVTNHGVIKTN
ncbi:hypothetical protein DERF_004723 [Dermatophagoides farinae]|uniref:Reverse transcriptase domain-containing protein n=1 Tax=Dermatophagoides farinae TaxID=6954 RepID=A0A922I2I6_DERFA|nr:hypothetical protein DERF_004723 [Dermatophagoides farinae]